MKVVGSRNRKVIYEPLYEPRIYRVRRLKCMRCNQIHHELPDLMVPYKRHSSALISEVIDGSSDEGLDPQQEKRLHHWFNRHSEMFIGLTRRALKVDLGMSDFRESGPAMSKLDTLKSLFHYHHKWLAYLVRLLVNLRLWPQTRSVWLSS